MRFLLILWSVALWAQHPFPVQGSHGMVTSRSTLASQAGVEIMKKGGNAIDAAVATGFALAVTYPSAGNLGGGGFMVIHLASGEVVTLDFREVAPSAASRDMYLNEKGEAQSQLSRKTHLSSGVPGSVDGLISALEKYGTMPLKDVIAPAIRLAKDGFALPPDIAEQFAELHEEMANYPGSKASFYKADGSNYQAGELWKQADLAQTLQAIADKGRAGFYQGPNAEHIVAEMKRGNGLISLEDLKNYKSKWRPAIHGTYRGLEIWSMPPPSSGGVLLINMLNMLEPYDLKKAGFGSAELIHLMIEAERRAYADRAYYLGDPDFVKIPVEELTSKAYAKQRFSDFDAQKASISQDIQYGQVHESLETTHFSVMDEKGNAVACTTTLNSGYGNKIVVQGAGFLLNNEMDDFSIKPFTPNSYGLVGEKANEIQPGKRMLSSMTPTIVTRDGKVYLVLGSPGGSTIITTVFQVFLNCVEYDMNIAQAVAMPRFHHQWLPDRIIYESFAISPDTLRILEKMGHQSLTPTRWSLGDANSIMVKDGLLFGATDPRNLSEPVGY
ncbi:MAG: gamma-glutamyltransferase [Acidobacteria bacterium]|nr:gamma-glutamyltransferase [Acidobacteriota bacterium]MCB9396767.1 gamma-glutamyltransferase [Acidobacteriota bacterium]